MSTEKMNIRQPAEALACRNAPAAVEKTVPSTEKPAALIQLEKEQKHQKGIICSKLKYQMILKTTHLEVINLISTKKKLFIENLNLL